MYKIKELIILYPSYDRGGATQNLINFINFCSNKNLKITFISNIKKKDNFFSKKKNIKLISLNDGIFSKYNNRYLTSVNSIIKLISFLKKANTKNVIVFSFKSHILPILICRLFLKRIIIRN